MFTFESLFLWPLFQILSGGNPRYHLQSEHISHTQYSAAVIPLLVVLVLLGILRLLIIPAFGEILRQWNAKVGARPPLSGTHYGLKRHQGARVGKRSAAPEKSPEWRHFRLAGVIMLLDVGAAATEEPDNNGKRYAVSSRASPSAHCIRLAPIPTGEMNGQAPHFESPSVRCPAGLT